MSQAYTVLLILCFVTPLSAQDWPALRGADGYGALSTENGILTKTSDVELKTRWKKKIGSGYSSVVVADGRVLAWFTDATDDLLVCLNASDGEQFWEYKTGPKFKGENGSFDGPLSTPLVNEGRVFALTPMGELLCISLDKGKKIWSLDLPQQTTVQKPLYGFVTSPIIAADTLILQLGAADQAIVGMDPATGEIRWSVGNDEINSQTPSLVNVAGKQMVLAVGGKKMMGIAPHDGKVFFEYEHQGGNASSVTPVPIGNSTFLLTLDDRFSKAVSVRRQANEEILVSETWQQPTIKNTYNIPVASGGAVFAYSTRILTCIDPATGRAHWKTREPGDGFLISVDGHLIINTKKGSLHLAKAGTDGYEEIVRLDLFEDLVWSVPAYSDNSVFVRSLGEVARVDIVPRSESGTTIATATLPTGKEFQQFLNRVKEAESVDVKKEIVAQWMDAQSEFPVIENDVVHFIYQGDQSDVALAGDFFGARQEKRMLGIDGTDLFYYSMRLPMDQRANYCYLIDFKPEPDILNERVMTSSMYAGEMEFAVRLSEEDPLQMSWLAMPDWREPQYLKDAGEKPVRTETREIELGDEEPTKIELLIALPPSYNSEDETRYPVAYVFDGSMAQEHGDMANAVNRLLQIENGPLEPFIVVFLKGGGPGFTEQLSNDIVPFVDSQYNTVAERQSRLIVGFGFSGGSALITAGAKNEVFGNVAVQSPLVFADAERMILEAMSDLENPIKIHLQWGRFDMFNPHENWDLRSASKKIFDELSKNEKLQVTGGMVNDSTDWASWKNRYHEIFELLNNRKPTHGG